MLLTLLVVVPLGAALACLVLPRRFWLEVATTGGALATLVLALVLAGAVMADGRAEGLGSWLYADALSALSVLIIAFVGTTAALYSVGYMRENLKERSGEGGEELAESRRYYLLFNLFLFAMLVVPVSNSLGVLWIAIEGTTLASLFLVSFYRTREALEAAWKYVIVGSVGIALALFGTILTYYSAVQVLGTTYDLNWSVLAPVAPRLDPSVMRLAFVFIVVGFGTKAGLAPMHTWLPDAHSEAPSPISALLSGVLLNTAMYAILRYYALATPSLGRAYPEALLLGFGLLSLLIAALFILRQQDIKRLLAYSSVEHMGIVSLGLAFGGALGLYGALLQMVGHALAKSLMFFASGQLGLRYGTKRIDDIAGALTTMPVTGAFLIVGALALTGSPPFGIFISEFAILSAGFQAGKALAALAMLSLIALIFIRFLQPINQMAFGRPATRLVTGEISQTGLLAMAGSLILVVGLGLFIPAPLGELLRQSAAVLGGTAGGAP
jgi:hydrogenase-4 component F